MCKLQKSKEEIITASNIPMSHRCIGWIKNMLIFFFISCNQFHLIWYTHVSRDLTKQW